MNHLQDYIEILQNILQDVCVDGITVSKTIIYNIFSKIEKTDIEKYRFSNELSELINHDIIKGYKIKVGRNGGITKNEQVTIRLIYPNGDISKDISKDVLQKLLTIINK